MDHQEPTNKPLVPSRRRFQLLAGTALVSAAALPGCATPDRSGTGATMPEAATGDWFDIVRVEHRAVDALFRKLLATTDRDIETRAALRNTIADSLTNHAIEEENVLYPALRMGGQRPESEQLYREHAELKVVLAELDAMPKNHPGWLERAKALQTMVLQHVQIEETQLYPSFRSRMTPEQNAMVTRMYRREGAKFRAA